MRPWPRWWIDAPYPRFTDGPPPYINAPWWEVIGAELRARELSQRAWVNELAAKWGLVRRADSLTRTESADQEDMIRVTTGEIFRTFRTS